MAARELDAKRELKRLQIVSRSQTAQFNNMVRLANAVAQENANLKKAIGELIKVKSDHPNYEKVVAAAKALL